MSLSALLLVVLLQSAPGHCYVVTNRRIILLPSCDFSPGSIADLMKSEPQPDPTRADPPSAVPYHPPAYGRLWEGPYGRGAPRRW